MDVKRPNRISGRSKSAEVWRKECNEEHAHSSFGYRTLNQFAAQAAEDSILVLFVWKDCLLTFKSMRRSSKSSTLSEYRLE